MSGPTVTVTYREQALARLVADAARAVTGVVRLQRRPAAGVVNRVGAAVRGTGADEDTSAIEVTRAADGALEVALRLVSTLRPTPLTVIGNVADAVSARLAEVGETDVRVEVTVTDVGI